MDKIDYQKQLDIILKAIKNYENENELTKDKDKKNQNFSILKKPSLLLHACCAPCSSYVIEYLSNFFDITIYYYNPNIQPESEYIRRLEELKFFLPKFSSTLNNKVKIVSAPYDPEDFFTATDTKNNILLQTEKEQGERCRRCYFFRMEKAYKFANANSFDFFTTTLSISPYKNSKMINEIGYQLEEGEEMKPAIEEISLSKSISFPRKNKSSGITLITKQIEIQKIFYKPNTGLHYLPADFKKNGGFLRSLELSKEYNLYRQDYCGCIFSKQNLQIKNS